MKKKLIATGIVLVICIAIFQVTFAQAEIKPDNTKTSNTTNTSQVYNAPTYKQMKNNLNNYLQAQKMNKKASDEMQKNIEANQNFNRHYIQQNPLPTVNETTKLASLKFQVAKLESGSYVKYTSPSQYWYDTQEHKRDMLKELKNYLANGRNGLPSFASCQAFHKCDQKPTLSLKEQVGLNDHIQKK